MAKFKLKYTDDMIQFLRDHAHLQYKDRAAAFNTYFNLNISSGAMRSLCARYKITSTADLGRKFKACHIEWLKVNVQKYDSWKAVGMAFNSEFHLNYTHATIRSTASLYHLKTSNSEYFATKDVIDWLNGINNKFYTYVDISKLLNSIFSLNLNTTQVKYLCIKHGIKLKDKDKTYYKQIKQQNKHRPINVSQIEFDGNQDKLVKIYSENKTYREITKELNDICNTSYTIDQITSFCKKKFGNKPRCNRSFTKLSKAEQDFIVESNKFGMSDLDITRKIQTIFNKKHDCKTISKFIKDRGLFSIKANNPTHYTHDHKLHSKPLHTIVKRNSGYYFIKIKDDTGGADNFIPYHRYIYESQYGQIPQDYHVVFLDGNKENFNIDNLYAIPMAIKCMMSKLQWWTSDPELTLTGILWCTLFRYRLRLGTIVEEV